MNRKRTPQEIVELVVTALVVVCLIVMVIVGPRVYFSSVIPGLNPCKPGAAVPYTGAACTKEKPTTPHENRSEK